MIPALILGFLMVLPFFYFQIKLGSGFEGIWPTVVDDESFYLARIKDVADGHSFISNAYLFEHKNGLPQQLFLAEWLLAQPLKLLKIDINIGRLIYNFLFPAAAFLLTYIALFLISRLRLVSAGFASFLFFGLYITSFIRPVSPQFNFIFWLTQFILLWLLINYHNSNNANNHLNNPNENLDNSEHSDKIRKFGLLSANALNFGLLFYIYPYYWTFYLIFFGILAVFYFWKERALFYKILMIASGGLILAIPYFYLNYLSSKLSYYTETLTRLGMIYTRFPSGIRIVFWSSLGLATFGLLLWRKIISWDRKSTFFISGLLASAVAVNQHVVTGRNFEFSSHYSMGTIFFLVFTAAYLASCLNPNNCDKNPNIPNGKKFGLFGYVRIFGLLIVAIIIISGLLNYLKRSLVIYANHAYSQDYASIFEWLNKNTQRDSVVYANRDISGLIPVYTADNVFYVREANLFFISDKEVLDRFIINNFFENLDPDFILKNARAIYGVRYIDAYGHAVQSNKLRRVLGIKLEPEIYLPGEEIEKVVNRAKELQAGDFEKELKTYRIDYLIWDKNNNPNWRINLKLWKPVFESGGLLIYRTK